MNMDVLSQCCGGGSEGGGSGVGINHFALLILLALGFGLWQALKWTRATWNIQGTSNMRKFGKIGLIAAIAGLVAVVAATRLVEPTATAGQAFSAPATTQSAKGKPKTSSAPASASHPATVEGAYPGLASSGLTFARPAELPKGTVLKAGGLTITEKQVIAEIAKAPETVQGQLRKNAFFLLERMATKALLLQEAKDAADESAKGADEQTLMRDYLGKFAQEVKVTDAEIADFHKNNADAVGGAELDAVKEQIADFLRQQKQQELINQHVRELGKRHTIEVSAAWTKAQALLAKDNPVGKARSSGKPSLVDFGAESCIPCKKMAPILKTLATKHEGKANVLFVSVVDEQVLAARYGVQSIPVQIFFDKDGKEVFRHEGFFSQEEIEEQLAKLGVK